MKNGFGPIDSARPEKIADGELYLGGTLHRQNFMLVGNCEPVQIP